MNARRCSAIRSELLFTAAAFLLAGCGGGEDMTGALQSSPTADAVLPLRATASAASVADQLMDFAEGVYPQYFPGHPVSVDLPPYRYRHYPETGIYLGVALDVVYVMGGTFGGVPRAVGPVTAYITPVDTTPVDLEAAAQLARNKNCLVCHAVDTKLIGPSFRSVSERYHGQSGAADLLASRIRSGGSGAWGSVPAPASPSVTPAEAKVLATAILAL